MNPNSPNRPSRRNVELPDPERRRHTPRRFSWVDHRLLRDDHLAACGCPRALALYLVLVTASDARGVSYYSDRSLAELLALSRDELVAARRRLVEIGLAAWRKPYYQVLSLDPDDIRQSRLRKSPRERGPERSSQPTSIAEVLRRMAAAPAPPDPDSRAASSEPGTGSRPEPDQHNTHTSRQPPEPRTSPP